jgi:hypothetical protein
MTHKSGDRRDELDVVESLYCIHFNCWNILSGYSTFKIADSLKRLSMRKFAVCRPGSDGTNSSVVLRNPSWLFVLRRNPVARFGVIRVLLLKMRVLWHMTSCRVQNTSSCRLCWGAFCLPIQVVSCPTTDGLHPEHGVGNPPPELSVTTVFVNKNGVVPGTRLFSIQFLTVPCVGEILKLFVKIEILCIFTFFFETPRIYRVCFYCS